MNDQLPVKDSFTPKRWQARYGAHLELTNPRPGEPETWYPAPHDHLVSWEDHRAEIERLERENASIRSWAPETQEQIGALTDFMSTELLASRPPGYIEHFGQSSLKSAVHYLREYMKLRAAHETTPRNDQTQRAAGNLAPLESRNTRAEGRPGPVATQITGNSPTDEPPPVPYCAPCEDGECAVHPKANGELMATPRTNAAASDGWSGDVECVSADFARGLERELVAAQPPSAARRICMVCGAALPGMWSMPSCPKCVEKAENGICAWCDQKLPCAPPSPPRTNPAAPGLCGDPSELGGFCFRTAGHGGPHYVSADGTPPPPTEPTPPRKWPGEPPHCPSCSCGMSAQPPSPATLPPGEHHLACVTMVTGGLEGPCDCGAVPAVTSAAEPLSDARSAIYACGCRFFGSSVPTKCTYHGQPAVTPSPDTRDAGSRPDELVTGLSPSSEIAKRAVHDPSRDEVNR